MIASDCDSAYPRCSCVKNDRKNDSRHGSAATGPNSYAAVSRNHCGLGRYVAGFCRRFVSSLMIGRIVPWVDASVTRSACRSLCDGFRVPIPCGTTGGDLRDVVHRRRAVPRFVRLHASCCDSVHR